MKIPKALKKGDTIGLISASGATPPGKLYPAIDSVEKLGFKVVVGETCRARHGYLAGADELRAAEVNQMFRDPNIDGIFCIRGGYGATKILPYLDYDMIQANPKVFAGYSDVTALHIVLIKNVTSSHIIRRCRLRSLFNRVWMIIHGILLSTT